MTSFSNKEIEEFKNLLDSLQYELIPTFYKIDEVEDNYLIFYIKGGILQLNCGFIVHKKNNYFELHVHWNYDYFEGDDKLKPKSIKEIFEILQKIISGDIKLIDYIIDDN